MILYTTNKYLYFFGPIVLKICGLLSIVAAFIIRSPYFLQSAVGNVTILGFVVTQNDSDIIVTFLIDLLLWIILAIVVFGPLVALSSEIEIPDTLEQIIVRHALKKRLNKFYDLKNITSYKTEVSFGVLKSVKIMDNVGNVHSLPIIVGNNKFRQFEDFLNNTCHLSTDSSQSVQPLASSPKPTDAKLVSEHVKGDWSSGSYYEIYKASSPTFKIIVKITLIVTICWFIYTAYSIATSPLLQSTSLNQNLGVTQEAMLPHEDVCNLLSDEKASEILGVAVQGENSTYDDMCVYHDDKKENYLYLTFYRTNSNEAVKSYYSSLNSQYTAPWKVESHDEIQTNAFLAQEDALMKVFFMVNDNHYSIERSDTETRLITDKILLSLAKAILGNNNNNSVSSTQTETTEVSQTQDIQTQPYHGLPTLSTTNG